MNFFRKKDKKECPSLKTAKSVSKKYAQLENCCAVLSRIDTPESSSFLSYSGGWRLWAYTVTSAGIDIEEVYTFIGDLAKKRKQIIECELAQLDT